MTYSSLSSWHDCHKACYDTNACTHWTYTPSKTCYLKKLNVVPKKPYNGLVSGPKKCCKYFNYNRIIIHLNFCTLTNLSIN